MKNIYCVEIWGNDVKVKKMEVKKETDKMLIMACGYPSRIMKSHIDFVCSNGDSVYTLDPDKGIELLRGRCIEDIEGYRRMIGQIEKKIDILDAIYTKGL